MSASFVDTDMVILKLIRKFKRPAIVKSHDKNKYKVERQLLPPDLKLYYKITLVF